LPEAERRNQLYVGLGENSNDAELWEYTPGASWSKVAGDGLNSSWGDGYEWINTLATDETNNKLYVGLGIGSGDADVFEFSPPLAGMWQQVGGDAVNSSWSIDFEAVTSFADIEGKLYAGLGMNSGDAEVWEYTPGGSWSKVGGDSVNSSWGAGYEAVYCLVALNGKLYASSGYSSGDAEVWEYTPGGSWSKVGGDSVNSSWGAGYELVQSSTVFDGKVYVGLGNSSGDAEVWEYTPGGSWSKVGGDSVNSSWATGYESVLSLAGLDGKLYAGLGESTGDAEVWQYTPGGSWSKVGGDGVNSSWTGNELIYSLSAHGGKLYAGLGDVGFVGSFQAATVWQYDPGTTAWTKVGGDGVNSSWDSSYENAGALRSFGGRLYVGLGSWANAGQAEVWMYEPN